VDDGAEGSIGAGGVTVIWGGNAGGKDRGSGKATGVRLGGRRFRR
jgi:hypothetical protein